MSAERKLTRSLLVRVAKYEMQEALNDGRLKRRVPLRFAVKELRRALKERRKVRRLFTREGNLENAIAAAQAQLRITPGSPAGRHTEETVEAQYEVNR